MEESVQVILLGVLLFVDLIAILAAVITRFVYGSRQWKRIGINGEEIKEEECREAAAMLTDFLDTKLDESGKRFEESSVGTEGLMTLRESKDVMLLVKHVHECGGRVVIRKISGEDLERNENTALEVKKKLSDMDIERAKRVNAKYK